MFNPYVARYCCRCGVYPVSEAVPNARICDVCFVIAMNAVLNEPFRCPKCDAAQELPADERFVCTACGYVEEVED